MLLDIGAEPLPLTVGAASAGLRKRQRPHRVLVHLAHLLQRLPAGVLRARVRVARQAARVEAALARRARVQQAAYTEHRRRLKVGDLNQVDLNHDLSQMIFFLNH